MAQIIQSRRGFLGSILALAAAPAIVRAESLMPIVAPKIWVPQFTGEIGRYEGFRANVSNRLDWQVENAMEVAMLSLVKKMEACQMKANADAIYRAFGNPSRAEGWRRSQRRRP